MSKLAGKVGTRYGRFAWHWRSDRETPRCGWSEHQRSHTQVARMPPHRVVKAIEGSGGKAIAIQADAADAEAVKAAVEKAVAAFGRLDVLVSNAGVAIPKPFEETTLDEMDRMFDINVRGTLVATHASLKHMKSGRSHHHHWFVRR